MISNVRYLSFLRGFTWLTIFLFMVNIPIQQFGVPESIRLSDLFWIVSLIPLVQYFNVNKWKVPLGNKIIGLFYFYILTILILPLIGMMLYGYPLNIYFGDFKWIQLISLFILLWYLYKNDIVKFEAHIMKFVWVLILFQVPFIVSQIIYVFTGTAGPLLTFWFYEGLRFYGNYGVHINRLSGSFLGPSSLALIGAIGFLIAGVKLYVKPDWKLVLLFLVSMVLIIASGSRSMIVGAPIILFLSYSFIFIRKLKLNKRFLTLSFVLGGGVILLVYLLFSFNIGRISGGRLIAVVDIISGTQTFEAVSGRGGDRWFVPIYLAVSEFSVFGTLANPVHVLRELPSFDNYYVMMIAQAGPILISIYIIMLLSLLYVSIKMVLNKQTIGIVVFSIVCVLIIYSFTSNLMTGMGGRSLLMLAVLCSILRR